MIAALLVALGLLLSPQARADDGEPEVAEKKNRGLAIAASVVPGVVLHGSGHWVLGEKKTARTLATLEGLGLAATALGAAPLALTGAQKYLAVPSISLLVAGTGVLLVTWLADVYGVSGRHRAGARARSMLPRASVELGYAFVHDPQFAHRSFASLEADLWWRRTRARPAIWIATGAGTRRARLDVSHRVRGAVERERRDGTHVDAVIAASWFDYSDDGFDVLGLEARVDARYDLARMARTLAGSFVSASGGLGLERFDYRVGASDLNSQLLLRFGFGAYLGRGRGELELYYDHRRDDLVGGLALANGGNGFLGSFGLRALRDVVGPWSVSAELAVGSAYVARVGLMHRFGRTR